MAKLTKHAEVLTQLHSMVRKQAEEAQKNISGTPGGDVKAVSVSDEHETTNKNSVGPENVAQGYSQKPSQDPSEPLSGSKSASDLGAEILDIIRKQAEAQDSVTGGPNTNNAESVSDEQESVDKNSVKADKNPQIKEQKGSTDSSKPLDSAKKAEVEDLAAKVASYELGRQFCAALLKAAATQETPDEAALMKEAGRRDFDLLIAQAAAELEEDETEKTAEAEQAGAEYFESLIEKEAFDDSAEQEGAAYFDTLLKNAALDEALQENTQLKEKLAEYESFFKQAEEEQAAEAYQAKLASSVASTVFDKLKTEIDSTAK